MLKLSVTLTILLFSVPVYGQQNVRSTTLRAQALKLDEELADLDRKYLKARIGVLEKTLKNLTLQLNQSLDDRDLAGANDVKGKVILVTSELDKLKNILTEEIVFTLSVSTPSSEEAVVFVPITSREVKIQNRWMGRLLSSSESEAVLANSDEISKRLSLWIIETENFGESTIKTRKKPHKYLVYEGENLSLKSKSPIGKEGRWMISSSDAYSLIESVSAKGKYLNCETGELKISPILEGWESAQWKISDQ